MKAKIDRHRSVKAQIIEATMKTVHTKEYKHESRGKDFNPLNTKPPRGKKTTGIRE